jgi:hypothetical protein
VTTALDKDLKRQIIVDGMAYTVALNAEGFRLTGKGKRKPEIELQWRDLLSGDTAMAVALNASLMKSAGAGAGLAVAQAEPQHADKRADQREVKRVEKRPAGVRAKR